MKKKILVTGGDGRFAAVLKEKNKKLNLVFKSKKARNLPHSPLFILSILAFRLALLGV